MKSSSPPPDPDPSTPAVDRVPAAEDADAPAHMVRGHPRDGALGRALALVRFLRERCPWDARQTPMTLRPYLLEEAHETADALAAGDDPALEAELGDLLLNVAFQIVLAEERGAFDAEGVVGALEAKMEARHPHVYGDADDPPDWEALKAAERATRQSPTTPDDPFEGLASGLDPLSRAARVQERMAAVGFDWPDLDGPLEKVREEASELADAAAGGRTAEIEDEVGDLLFAAVNAARLAGAHPANAMLLATRKFETRCRRMIELAEHRGIDWTTAGLETLDELWDVVKSASAGGGADAGDGGTEPA